MAAVAGGDAHTPRDTLDAEHTNSETHLKLERATAYEYGLRAHLHAQAGDTKSAYRYLEQMAEPVPPSASYARANLQLLRGGTYHHLGQTTEARTCYQRVLEFDPTGASAMQARAALAKMGKAWI